MEMLRVVAPCLALSLWSAMSNATPIAFDFAATYDDGSVASGQLYIDTTIGSITSAAIALGSPTSTMFDSIVGQGANGFGVIGHYGFGLRDSASTIDLNVSLSDASLVGYSGGQISLSNTFILGPGGGPGVFLVSGSGSLTPVAVPEPASLALLCLAGAGLAFRSARTKVAAAA